MSKNAQSGSFAIEGANLRRLRSRLYHLLERGTILPTDISNSLYVENGELYFGDELVKFDSNDPFDISGTWGVIKDLSGLDMLNEPIKNVKYLDLTTNTVLPNPTGLSSVSNNLYWNGNQIFDASGQTEHPFVINNGVLYTNPAGLGLNIDAQTTTNDLVVVADTSLNNLVFDDGECKGAFGTFDLIFTDASGEELKVQLFTAYGDVSCNSTTKTQNLNVYGNGNYYGLSVFNTTQTTNDAVFNGTLYANSNSDFDGHLQANSSITVNGVLTANNAVDFNSTLNVDGTSAFNAQVSTNSTLIANGAITLNGDTTQVGNYTQNGDFTTGSTANTYISDQSKFNLYEADWASHTNPVGYANSNIFNSTPFSNNRGVGYKDIDLELNYSAIFYIYKLFNRVEDKTSYTMSVGGSINGVSSQNQPFYPLYKLNSASLFNADGGSVSPTGVGNLLEMDYLSCKTMMTTPKLIVSDALIGTADVNRFKKTFLQQAKAVWDFVKEFSGSTSTIAQIVEAIAGLAGELGSAVIIGGAVLGGSILVSGAILGGAGIMYNASQQGEEKRADSESSRYNSAMWGKPTQGTYDLSNAGYYEQPIGYALDPCGNKLSASDASNILMIDTFGVNQINGQFSIVSVNQTNELTGVVSTLPEAEIWGNADRATGISYPVCALPAVTGWSHTPKLYSVELNDYTTAFNGKYLNPTTRTYLPIDVSNRIYSVDGNLYHDGKRVGDQLPAVVKLGANDGGLDDVMGISMETASGFNPAKNYFIGTQNGTFGMDAIQSNSVDNLGNTLGLEFKVGSEYYMDLAGKSTGANTDPSSVLIYKPLLLDDGVNAKFNVGDWLYDISTNGVGGGVFTGAGTTATLQSTYTTLDASQADVNYRSLQSRYNSAGTSGLTTIEPTSANTLTIKSEQPPSSSIGSRVILNAQNPTYGNRDTLEVNGYYDQAICYGNLFIADSNTTGGRYQHPLIYMGSTNRSYPNTDQALWYSNTSNTLNWQTNYILTTNTSGYLDLKVGSLGIDTGDILRWKDIKSTPIATKLMRIEGLDYVDSGYDRFLEFDCSSATPILTMGDSGAGQVTADWNIQARQGVWLPDTSQSITASTLTNQSGDLYWGTQKLAEASGHLPLTGGTLTGQLSIEYNTSADPMLTLRKSNQNSASTILIKNDYNSNEIQIGSQQLVPYYGITYKNIISASGDLLIVSNSSNSHFEMGEKLRIMGQNNAIDFADVYIGTPTTSTLYLKDISSNLGIGTRTILDSANWSNFVTGGGGGGGAGDDNYFYSTAGTVTMDVSNTFQNINFNQLVPCKVFNSGSTLQLTGGGSTYASMLLDSTSNEQIDFNLGTSSPGTTILRIKDDATNYNPTLDIQNTNTSNTECSIKTLHANGASYFAKFGVNNVAQAFVYSNGDRIQLYVNGGTAITLRNSTFDGISYSPSTWGSGFVFQQGLGNLSGDPTSYGRYIEYSYTDGMTYNSYGNHLFKIHNGSTFADVLFVNNAEAGVRNNRNFTIVNNSNNYTTCYPGEFQIKRLSGNQIYFGIGSGNSAQNDFNIYNASTGALFQFFNNGNMKISGSTYGTSDVRVKKNIQTIKDDEALKLVKAIEPKTYQYIDEETRGSKVVYGWIAQEVKAVFPQAVETTRDMIPNILKPVGINGDVITFNEVVDIEVGKCIFLRDLLGRYDVYVDEEEPTYDTSGNPIGTRVIKRKIDKRIDYGQIEIVKRINPNTYQINQSLNYTSGFCVGIYVDDFNILSKEKLTPILWAGVQEQQRTIEKQQTTIDKQALIIAEQAVKLTKLMSKVDRIEQLLLSNNIK